MIFPEGPFSGVCGVVWEVDARRERLRIGFSEGIAHREAAYCGNGSIG